MFGTCTVPEEPSTVKRHSPPQVEAYVCPIPTWATDGAVDWGFVAKPWYFDQHQREDKYEMWR